MHTQSRHQGWKPQKWTGKGPVHSPAAVTIRWEKQQTNRPHQKQQKQQKTNKPNNLPKQNKARSFNTFDCMCRDDWINWVPRICWKCFTIFEISTHSDNAFFLACEKTAWTQLSSCKAYNRRRKRLQLHKLWGVPMRESTGLDECKVVQWLRVLPRHLQQHIPTLAEKTSFQQVTQKILSCKCLSHACCHIRLFFRPTPYGFRQVVQHVSKHVAYEIN